MNGYEICRFSASFNIKLIFFTTYETSHPNEYFIPYLKSNKFVDELMEYYVNEKTNCKILANIEKINETKY